MVLFEELFEAYHGRADEGLIGAKYLGCPIDGVCFFGTEDAKLTNRYRCLLLKELDNGTLFCIYDNTIEE